MRNGREQVSARGKEPKQAWEFLRREPKRSLGAGSKLVKMSEGGSYRLLGSGFDNSCDKVVSQSSEAEGHLARTLISCFLGTEEGQRALPALAASRVILVQNNQHAVVACRGAAHPGPQQNESRI